MFMINVILTLFRSLLMGRNKLAMENLALRQQLAVLPRTAKQSRLCPMIAFSGLASRVYGLVGTHL